MRLSAALLLLSAFCSCTYVLGEPIELKDVGLRVQPPSKWRGEKFATKYVFKPIEWAKEPRPSITIQSVPTEMELDSFMAADYRNNITKYEGFVPIDKNRYVPGENYDWGYNTWTYKRPDGLEMYVYRRYYELPEHIAIVTIEATRMDWLRNEAVFQEFLNRIVVLMPERKVRRQ